MIAAGGALGTPELLLRSGLGGDQVGRNLHLHPAAWIGARYPEEVRGWEGVMQSYYIDQWEPQSILLEATFTPLPFGGAWLLGTGRKHQEAMLGFANVGSIGVHLSDRSSGRIGLSSDGSLRATYKLTDDDARRHRVRDRPRGRGPLRRRSDRGLSQHRPRRRPEVRPARRLRGDHDQALGAAPGGLSPDGDGADRIRPGAGRLRADGRGQRSRRASTSPTPRCSRPRSASTR